jgi:hypothetical protein
MRLHTKLTYAHVYGALKAAKDKGKITTDVMFVNDKGPARSSTHQYAYEIQLGTYNKDSLPEGYKDQHGKKMNVRRFKNSGNSGATSGWYEPAVWSATYDEWGWFIVEIFAADPTARWGGIGKSTSGYRNLDDFHVKTNGRFK